MMILASFLPFKGRIKVGMDVTSPWYNPILTPSLSLKEKCNVPKISLHYFCVAQSALIPF